MKKTLLLLLTISLNAYGFSQCTPNPAYEGETFGFWPDASIGLSEGFADAAYTENVTIKSPANGGEIDEAYAAYNIESIVVNSVTGLPSGYDYSCNNAECLFPGGTLNCLEIFGTTSEIGEFPITINLSINAELLGSIITLPYGYTEYTLSILDPNGVEELDVQNVVIGQNIPNPMTDYTIIPFSVKDQGTITFEVFNMMGEKLFEQIVVARVGDNELKYYAEELNTGIYLYSFTNDGFTQTRRMMVRK